MIKEILSPTAQNVKEYFAGHFQDFYSKLIELHNGNGNEFKAVCPFHDDSDPSLSINGDTGLFKCFGCNASGDAFHFYGKLKCLSSFPDIVAGIARDFGISGNGKQQSRIVKTYDYRDANGVLLYQAVRMEPKDFRQRRPDGKGDWTWNMQGVDKILYHLPEIVSEDLVFVVEGEKDVDNLFSLGIPATTNVGGAGKWMHEYSVSLKGKDVVILPDNDEPGQGHAEKIARMIHGIAKSVKIIELPGLPEKGDVSDWISQGGTKEGLQRLIEDAPVWEPSAAEPEPDSTELFPRGPFPWEVLPVSIAESLKQLARSCATSATSLPGAAIAIFASLIGSVVSVSAKASWIEHLIAWFMDIRGSGEGKTAGARALCNVLYSAQRKADDSFQAELTEYNALAPIERRGVPAPARPRGYFMTDLTLEGVREDVQSGHGGCVAIHDELSSFVSSQNQYKAKGNDRESWLCLHDGNPARVVRAGKSITIRNARISIFGGIQPTIWKKCFSGKDGEIFLHDGTIFRFLPVYEGPAYHPLTSESWSQENKALWEELLTRAMQWANSRVELGETRYLILAEDAQSAFLEWANNLRIVKDDLPESVRGFIPKLIGYSLRLAGILYLIDVFHRHEEPGKVLNVSDIQKGMKVSEFYLGHIIEAMKSLVSDNAELPFERTEQTSHIARTLEALRDDVDNGLLAVGFIQDFFNKDCADGLHVSSPKAMGAILRRCGLTIQKKKHWKDQHGVSCLRWDEKTEKLLKESPQSPQSPQSKENQDVKHEDIEKSKSSQVLINDDEPESMRTLRTLENQSPHTQSTEIIKNEDIEDIEDVVSKESDNSDLDWRF